MRREQVEPIYSGWMHVGRSKDFGTHRKVRVSRSGEVLELVRGDDGTIRVTNLDKLQYIHDQPQEHGGIVFCRSADRSIESEEQSAPPIGILTILQVPGRWHSFARVTAHARVDEPAENSADRAHFPIVHGAAFKSMGQYDWVVENNVFTIRATTTVHGIKRECPFLLEYFDAFNSNTVNTSFFSPDTNLISMVAPVGSRTIDLLLLADSRRTVPVWDWVLNRSTILSSRVGAKDDRRIWERKRVLDHPQLSDADGPILQFRRWHSQFQLSGSSTERTNLKPPDEQQTRTYESSQVQ